MGIKGLTEIHRSSLGVHGNLTSSTCLIDNRWVFKLTNFGMDMFRSKGDENGIQPVSKMFHGKDDENSNQPVSKSDLWKAPELLKDKTSRPTKETDIYSYA